MLCLMFSQPLFLAGVSCTESDSDSDSCGLVEMEWTAQFHKKWSVGPILSCFFPGSIQSNAGHVVPERHHLG